MFLSFFREFYFLFFLACEYSVDILCFKFNIFFNQAWNRVFLQSLLFNILLITNYPLGLKGFA